MRPRWKRMVLIAPLAILALALFIVIGGQAVRLLWNWLLPPLFGWREISFWQAVGLLALCRILFGRSGWHRSGGSNLRRRMQERCAHRVEERSANMTPEERERLRQRMRERWGSDPTAGESQGR